MLYLLKMINLLEDLDSTRNFQFWICEFRSINVDTLSVEGVFCFPYVHVPLRKVMTGSLELNEEKGTNEMKWSIDQLMDDQTRPAHGLLSLRQIPYIGSYYK